MTCSGRMASYASGFLFRLSSISTGLSMVKKIKDFQLCSECLVAYNRPKRTLCSKEKKFNEINVL